MLAYIQTHLSKRIISFLVIGFFSTLVHFIVLSSLVEFVNMPPLDANVIAFFASLASSFQLNHKYTFKSKKKYHKTFLKYLITVLIGLTLNQTIMWIGLDIFNLSYTVSFAFVVVLVPMSNYILHSIWTFR